MKPTNRKQTAGSSSTSDTSPSDTELAALRAFQLSENSFRHEITGRKRPSSSTSEIRNKEPSKSTKYDNLSQSTKLQESELEKISKTVLCTEPQNITSTNLSRLEKIITTMKTPLTALSNTYTTTKPSNLSTCSFSILDRLQSLVTSSISQSSLKTTGKTFKLPNRRQQQKPTAAPSNLDTISKPQERRNIASLVSMALLNTRSRNMIHLGLPYELILQIFTFISWSDLYRVLKFVCKDWNDCIERFEHFIVGGYSTLDMFSGSFIVVCNECNGIVICPHKKCKNCCENCIEEESPEESSSGDEIEDVDGPTLPNGFIFKKRMELILENIIVEYCNQYREKIVDFLREGESSPSTDVSIIRFNMLNSKCLEFVVSQIFPNVKRLSGSGLTLGVVQMFRERLQTLDFSNISIPPVVTKPVKKSRKKKQKTSNVIEEKPIAQQAPLGPFPMLREIFWEQNERFHNSTQCNPERLSPLFENVTSLVLAKNSIFNADFPNILSKNKGILVTLDLSLCKLLDEYIADEMFRLIKLNESLSEAKDIKCLKYLNLSGCGQITARSLSTIGQNMKHLTCLHLNTPKTCRDLSLMARTHFALSSFRNLEELSLEGNRSFYHDYSTFVRLLTSCSFGSSLKILNIKGTYAGANATQKSNVHMGAGNLLAGSIMGTISPYTTKSSVSDAKYDFKVLLTDIFNWMTTPSDIKLVLTDIGEFYLVRQGNIKQTGRFIWKNRLPPYNNIIFVRKSNKECYYDPCTYN